VLYASAAKQTLRLITIPFSFTATAGSDNPHQSQIHKLALPQKGGYRLINEATGVFASKSLSDVPPSIAFRRLMLGLARPQAHCESEEYQVGILPAVCSMSFPTKRSRGVP